MRAQNLLDNLNSVAIDDSSRAADSSAMPLTNKVWNFGVSNSASKCVICRSGRQIRGGSRTGTCASNRNTGGY